MMNGLHFYSPFLRKRCLFKADEFLNSSYKYQRVGSSGKAHVIQTALQRVLTGTELKLF